MVCKVVNRLFAKAFSRSAFRSVVDITGRTFLTEPHLTSEVVTTKIEYWAFMVSVAEFVSREVKKHSLEMADIDVYQNVPKRLF